MVVLIGNLPKQAVEKDLCHLLGVAPGTRIRIVKKPGREAAVQRFALVPVDSVGHARRLIEKAHGIEWRGHTLAARVYQHRTGANERRRLDWRNQAWSGEERRAEERRSFAADYRSRVA